MRILPVFAVLPLVACGPDLETACENYITAYNDCATEYAEAAGGDGTELDAETTCAAYDGVTGAAADEAADTLQCYADTYNNADCSTADGWSTASTDFATCG